MLQHRTGIIFRLFFEPQPLLLLGGVTRHVGFFEGGFQKIRQPLFGQTLSQRSGFLLQQCEVFFLLLRADPALIPAGLIEFLQAQKQFAVGFAELHPRMLVIAEHPVDGDPNRLIVQAQFQRQILGAGGYAVGPQQMNAGLRKIQHLARIAVPVGQGKLSVQVGGESWVLAQFNSHNYSIHKCGRHTRSQQGL